MSILQFSSHSLDMGFPKECHVEIQLQSICSKNDALLMLCQKYKASVSKKNIVIKIISPSIFN